MRTSKSPELLSPVGDWDSLQAAIQNGADAVYLGVKDFNARLYTRNFSIKELSRVVGQAHSHGVRVYLTLNTLVKNHEIGPFFNVITGVYLAGEDGVIIFEHRHDDDPNVRTGMYNATSRFNPINVGHLYVH